MSHSFYYMARDQLQALINELRARGYQCIGPQVRDGAIVYDSLADCTQLPRGISEHQSPGRYVLSENNSQRYFSWANGPQAIKPYVFAPRESLWRCEKDNTGQLRFTDLKPAPGPVAIIGVRACDLAALYIQDKHFLQEEKKDPYYLARRQKLFLVAVNCTHAADTCFCASTGDGPRASYGYDIVLSELDDGFLAHGLSDKGLELIKQLSTSPPTETQLQQADEEIQHAARRQTRRLPSRNLKQALFNNLEHPRWEEVAKRCLACGNCTSVCPTCFCHAEDEEPALDGSGSEYFRQWDSCFTQGHSYIHGITIRSTTAQRYRQWLTHKLGSWHDQYGRSGCVGCGRCITWCPVGIDITEEAAAICGENIDA
ncbi:MAG: 4Fe-4S dicluster domain-containing protein [Gammaproteobacteria bacterium]|nr:4Fe-4S dicluster domain-containing protein [Gammaproteobacteria bacterium]